MVSLFTVYIFVWIGELVYTFICHHGSPFRGNLTSREAVLCCHLIHKIAKKSPNSNLFIFFLNKYIKKTLPLNPIRIVFLTTTFSTHQKRAKIAEDSAVFVHLGDSSVLCQISPITKCVHVYTNHIKAKGLIKQRCPNLCWWRRINILTCHKGRWRRTTMALHSQHQMAQSITADHCQAFIDIYYTSLSYPFRKTSSSRLLVSGICVF